MVQREHYDHDDRCIVPYDNENENTNTKLLPMMTTKTKMLRIHPLSEIHKAITHTANTTYMLPM